jgi:hypothetical protein
MKMTTLNYQVGDGRQARCLLKSCQFKLGADTDGCINHHDRRKIECRRNAWVFLQRSTSHATTKKL